MSDRVVVDGKVATENEINLAAQYMGRLRASGITSMTKVCMRKSIAEQGRIVRFGLCGFPPDSEEWRQCGFAIGQHEIPVMVEIRKE